MKKIIFLIIIILIVAGALFFIDNQITPEKQEPLNLEEFLDQKVNLSSKKMVEFGKYKILTEQSVLNWEGRKVILKDYNDTGTLKIKEGEISVSGGQGQNINKIESDFLIDMNSLAITSTDSPGYEEGLIKHLKSADFFDVEKYPTAQFKVSSLTSEKGVEENFLYSVRGDLTIKDITKEIEFPAIIYQEENLVYINATISLDRTLWNIKYNSAKFFDNLADKVIDDMFSVSLILVAQKVD